MKKITLYCSLILISCISCNSNNDNTGAVKDSSDIAASMEKPGAVTSTMPDNMPASADGRLVYELIESMYAGIALMKEGESKGTDPSFKKLAQKLVMEHTMLTKEMEDLAKKKEWKLPPGEPEMDMQKRKTLVAENVDQFQKDWLMALRERHETNIAKLENAKPTDPDVKSAGEKGLPKIKELLGDIKKVQASMK